MTVRPKRILWPTDFSELATKALDYARDLREVFGAELHVVHVVSEQLVIPPPGFPSLSKEALNLAHTKVLEDASAHLKRVVDPLSTGNSSVKCVVLSGTPWVEICNYAKSFGVDLIVIATHGVTGLKHILLGSVAERVVQHAACPVLVVKSVERDFIDTSPTR
jgi:nucleotide-binding universal stress UspA family protein